MILAAIIRGLTSTGFNSDLAKQRKQLVSNGKDGYLKTSFIPKKEKDGE